MIREVEWSGVEWSGSGGGRRGRGIIGSVEEREV